MIICKDGPYAYIGETAAEAYNEYISAGDDHHCFGPHELEWYSTTEMTLTMSLTAKSKPAKPKSVKNKKKGN